MSGNCCKLPAYYLIHRVSQYKSPVVAGLLSFLDKKLIPASPLAGYPYIAAMTAAPSSRHPEHTRSWHYPITIRPNIAITMVYPPAIDPDMARRRR